MDRRVAARYAEALYRTAAKLDLVASVEADLDAIQGALDSDGPLAGFLSSPRIGREEKIQIVDRLFSDRVTALTSQFLRLLLNKRREKEFTLIREEFQRIRRENSNVLFAKVTSDRPLDDAQKSAIVAKLGEKTGKQVEASFDINPTLLGGVKVQLGDYVLDGTVKGSLTRLRDRLRYDLLKQS